MVCTTGKLTLVAAHVMSAGGVMDIALDSGFAIPRAEGRIGRPVTPVSYAGVARRTTVRAVTPGVGMGGIGGPASGVGVLPGAGAGQLGVGYSGGVGVNLGGPVNRVGVR